MRRRFAFRGFRSYGLPGADRSARNQSQGDDGGSRQAALLRRENFESDTTATRHAATVRL